MSEKIAENILDRIVETLADGGSKQKSVSFFGEEKTNFSSSQFNRLFGLQKPVHHLLGGGKSADVLLWRNKKISASVLTVATIIWVLLEWLNYHFLTLVSFALLLGMLAQFIWSNASGLFNSGRSHSKIPRLVIRKEIFVNIATSLGAEVNRALDFLQDVAYEGNIKQFLGVIVGLWFAAVVGSWCNFLTVLYVGFVAAHTLPVLYERYKDQVDSFVNQVIEQIQHNYRKLDAGVLSRIPKGKKHE